MSAPTPLTDRRVRAAKCPDGKTHVDMADAHTGLRLRVSSAGSRTWLYRYRIKGQQRLMVIGRYYVLRAGEASPADHLGLADARAEVMRLKTKVRAGIDPKAEREATAQAEAQAQAQEREAEEQAQARIANDAKLADMPFKALVRDVGERIRDREHEHEHEPPGHPEKTFREIAAEWLGKKEHHVRPRTFGEYRRFIESDLLPKWGDRQIRSINAGAIDDLLTSLPPTLSNRARIPIKGIFKRAERQGVIETSPMAKLDDLKPAKLEARERVLSDHELRMLVRWLRGDHPGMLDKMAAGLLVTLYTGQRIGEVAGMHRDELAGDVWTIPEHRAKNGKAHRVFLSEPVMQILATRPEAGRVFAVRPDSAPTSLKKAWGEMGRRGEDNLPTPHDLRRTLATWLGERGVPNRVLKRVLNHGAKGVTEKVYDHATRDEPAREAWSAWAAHVDAVSADGVVHFGRRA